MGTIAFRCSKCGQSLKVGSDKAGRRGKCSKCGESLTIPAASDEAAAVRARPAPPAPKRPPVQEEDLPEAIEGPESEDDAEPSLPARRRRPVEEEEEKPRARKRAPAEAEIEEAEEEQEPQPKKKKKRRQASPSGLVTALAVIHFVVGGLSMVCGVMGMFSGLIIGGLGQKVARQNAGDMTREQADMIGMASGAFGIFLIVMAGVLAASGLFKIIAGIGLVKRQNWGRIMALVLAGLAAAMALYDIPTKNLPAATVDGAYAAFVFAVLLSRRYADEFA